MKISNVLLFATLVALLPATAAMARGGDWNKFDHRLDRQDMRIENGIESGELTRKEARRLRKQQRRIARLKRDFRRDGHLTRKERRTLKNELSRASKRIYRLKHNDRYRKSRHRHHRKHRWPDNHGRYANRGIIFSDDGLTIYLGYSDHW